MSKAKEHLDLVSYFAASRGLDPLNLSRYSKFKFVPRVENDPIEKFLGTQVNAIAASKDSIPKKIWMLWDSGIENAPDIVKRSVETWRQFNPDYELNILTMEDFEELLGVKFAKLEQVMSINLGIQGISDLIRVLLLVKYGGVWADATTFCLRPLDEWLHEPEQNSGFFCFRHDYAETDRKLVSWFLAARPQHPILVDLLDASWEYLTRPRDKKIDVYRMGKINPALGLKGNIQADAKLLERCERELGVTSYFWIFYLFSEVIKRQKYEWEKVEKLPNRYLVALRKAKLLAVSDVSKQQWVPEYTNTPNYKKRLEILFDGQKLRKNFRQEFDNLSNTSERPLWREIFPNMQISEKHKVVFVHIPKCGGTSVDESNLFAGKDENYGHANLEKYKYILGDRIDEFRFFTFVRNPWERLASAFYYSTHVASNLDTRHSKQAQRIKKEFKGDFNSFLSMFCKENERFISLIWFRPMKEFFNPNDCKQPFFIQKLENIENIDPLRKFLRFDEFDVGHKRVGPISKGDRDPFPNWAIKEVADIYADDIKLFGYKNTAPKSK